MFSNRERITKTHLRVNSPKSTYGWNYKNPFMGQSCRDLVSWVVGESYSTPLWYQGIILIPAFALCWGIWTQVSNPIIPWGIFGGFHIYKDTLPVCWYQTCVHMYVVYNLFFNSTNPGFEFSVVTSFILCWSPLFLASQPQTLTGVALSPLPYCWWGGFNPRIFGFLFFPKLGYQVTEPAEKAKKRFC